MLSSRVHALVLSLAGLCAVANVSEASTPTLALVAGPIQVGSEVTLSGSGITPGSVLKVYVATAGGPVDVSSASGLTPTSTTDTTFTLTLPLPWPVADPDTQFTVGNGFVSLQLVRTDTGYDSTNLVGAVLLGNDALGVPSVTGINGTPLSTSSTDPAIGLANVETIVVPGATMTIEGSGFDSSVVNIFTEKGNLGPLTPSSQSATSISVAIPIKVPIGPGSVQVVNATGDFRASNSVSAPIGALVTVTSVELNGTTVTVHGTGFNSLTVINLFAHSGGTVVNAGGFDPGGNPYLPLELVDATEFSFQLPDGLDPGAAYLQAINPPFIPYTTSQGSGGSFPLVIVTAGMVLVPAGPFTMGQGAGSGIDGDNPAHTVELSAYWIDRNDVTVDEYAACVTAGDCPLPTEVHDGNPTCNYGAPLTPNDHPINSVDWTSAAAYCAYVGKRLQTEAEWEKAARGTDARTYPWGEAAPTCDYAVIRDPVEGYGCGLDGTWPVGSKVAGMSPFGAFDMAGNVFQWVNDWYDPNYYAQSPSSDPQGPASGTDKVLRGGGWALGPPNDYFSRSSYRYFENPALGFNQFGFRCAQGG